MNCVLVVWLSQLKPGTITNLFKLTNAHSLSHSITFFVVSQFNPENASCSIILPGQLKTFYVGRQVYILGS